MLNLDNSRASTSQIVQAYAEFSRLNDFLAFRIFHSLFEALFCCIVLGGIRRVLVPQDAWLKAAPERGKEREKLISIKETTSTPISIQI